MNIPSYQDIRGLTHQSGMAKFLSRIPKYTNSWELSVVPSVRGLWEGKTQQQELCRGPTTTLLRAEHAVGAWGYQWCWPELSSLPTFSLSWRSKFQLEKMEKLLHQPQPLVTLHNLRGRAALKLFATYRLKATRRPFIPQCELSLIAQDR